MSETPVGADVYKPLGVHAHIPAKFPFDLEQPLDHPADSIDLVLSQVLHPDISTDIRLTNDPPRGRTSDSIDISEGHFQPFLAREIYPCNPRHSLSFAVSCQLSAISRQQ
jgi:hypothetical protein